MNRALVAHTPLGETWWAISLRGIEALSSLYEFRLELKSKESDIDIQAMIGETCVVECKASLLSTIRYFSGLVVGAATKGKSGKHWLYELTIAPKLWFASQRADFKIYQNLTIQTIADEVLQQNAINYEWRLKNSYKTWEYVVQYGETDLAFLLRLLGHEGIYFWFEHSESGEKLILGDHFSVHEPFAGYATIPYYPPDASRVDEDHFHGWHARRVAKPGKLVQTSYDFTQPSKDLKTESADPRGHLFDQYEIFSYPGAYTESGHGQEYTAARLQGIQSDQDIIVLEGSVRGAIPGYCFKLEKHPVESQNREFTIVRAEYRARNNEYEADNNAPSEEASFHVKVSAMPADRQYRTPSDKYEMPHAHGPDTAIVVGPSGSEIHTDKYGRIKVHFHWDRYGKKDGSDSCWVRVASPWAGTSVSTISIPRVGQEVVVDYEHGDPQRPIITSCVYNAQQAQFWNLPANKTQSGFMSRSTPGGGADNFNALRFENAKGQEEVWLHAERNLEVKVKNDAHVEIDGNLTATVGKHCEVTVGEGREVTINGGEGDTLHVTAGKRIENLDKGREVTIAEGGDKLTITAGGRDETITAGGDKLTVAADGREATITGGDTLTVGSGGREATITGGDKLIVDGGRNVTINTGDHHTEVSAGSFTVHATGPISIKSDADKNEIIQSWSNKIQWGAHTVNLVDSITVSPISMSFSGISTSSAAISNSFSYLSVGLKAIDISNKPIRINAESVRVGTTATKIAHRIVDLNALNLTVYI